MGEKLFWSILGFAFGFGAGGYFIGSNVSKKAKQRIRELEEELEIKKSEEEDIEEEEEHEEKSEPPRRRRIIYRDIASIDDLIDEDYESKEDSDEENDIVEDESKEGEILAEVSDENDFTLITQSEFHDELPFRDDETIYYYQKDGVLVDSAFNKIDDVRGTVGSKCLELLKSTNDDYIYLSNDVEDKMYEIFVERNQTYYADVVTAHVEEEET